VRHTRVDPPAGTHFRARHFVDSFFWLSGVKEGQTVRSLHWYVEEIHEEQVNLVAFEHLLEEPGSLWPPPPLPRDSHAPVAFTMNEYNEVEYFIAGQFQRRNRITAIGQPLVAEPRSILFVFPHYPLW
jgi:hypothetical protein